MLINIVDEFIDVKCGDKVCKVKIPTLEESGQYYNDYDAAKNGKAKDKVLKDYLIGLGLDEDVYKQMRASHLRSLIEAFSEKKK